MTILAEPTAEARPERPPLPSMTDTIDQLVVDGVLVSSREPVSLEAILAPVLGPEWRTSPRLFRVLNDLSKDRRYLGFDEARGLMFKPEMSAGSRVTMPSWQAVMARRVDAVPDGYVEEILSAMLSYTSVIYRRHDNRPRPIQGVVPIRELWGMLDWQRDNLTQLGAPPNARNFAAFIEFIRLDGNGFFEVLPDQRVVLVGGVFKGKIEDIKPLSPVQNMQAVVEAAVKIIGPKKLVTNVLVLRTIEETLGMFVTPAQQAMLRSCMLNIPNVRSGGLSRYCILDTTMHLPTQRAAS